MQSAVRSSRGLRAMIFFLACTINNKSNPSIVAHICWSTLITAEQVSKLFSLGNHLVISVVQKGDYQTQATRIQNNITEIIRMVKTGKYFS